MAVGPFGKLRGRRLAQPAHLTPGRADPPGRPLNRFRAGVAAGRDAQPYRTRHIFFPEPV